MAMISEEVFKQMPMDKMYEVYCLCFEEKTELKSISEQLGSTLKILEEALGRIDALEGCIGVVKAANVSMKKENDRLRQRIDDIEFDLDKTEKGRVRDNQYTRRENIELINIPVEVQQSQLKSTVTKMLNKVGIDITPRDISACHRLKGGKKTIVRFINRDDAYSTLEKFTEMKNCDFTDILGSKPTVYVNPNLAPELRTLLWRMKSLKADGIIEFYGSTSNGVYYQTARKGRKHFVYGETDFYDVVDECDFEKYFG